MCAAGNPTCLTDIGGRSPDDAANIPRDEHANYNVGHETIEIIATKPDELSVQIALGNSHFSSRAEHDRQLISTIEEERLYSVQDREDAYERDPEGALQAWNNYAGTSYAKARSAAAGELGKQQRVMAGAIPFVAAAVVVSIMGAMGAWGPPRQTCSSSARLRGPARPEPGRGRR